MDYLFTKGEYTTLFEHFELLGTLAYIALANDKPTLQAALQARDYVQAPMGRAAWDGRTADSDEVARVYRYEVARGFRDDVAHLSDLISPGGEAF